jgi:hypothetical protein
MTARREPAIPSTPKRSVARAPRKPRVTRTEKEGKTEKKSTPAKKTTPKATKKATNE